MKGDTIAVHTEKNSGKVENFLEEDKFTEAFLKLYNNGERWGCYYIDGVEIVADDRKGNTMFNIVK